MSRSHTRSARSRLFSESGNSRASSPSGVRSSHSDSGSSGSSVGANHPSASNSTRALSTSNAASSCAGSTSNWASSIVPSANSLAVVKWKSTRLNPSENSVWPSGSPARAITVTPMIPCSPRIRCSRAMPPSATHMPPSTAPACRCSRARDRANPATAVGNCVGSGAPNATAMSPVAGSPRRSCSRGTAIATVRRCVEPRHHIPHAARLRFDA